MNRIRFALFTFSVAAALLAGCVHTAPLGNPLNGLAQLRSGEAMRASSSDANWLNGNADARPIAPGATLTLADLEGPGVINHFWNTIAATDRGYSRLLVLRMYWDGEEHPSVECPIGDFFGIGHGLDQPYQSLPIAVSSEGRARNCYWPMPFRKSAKITVTNEGHGPVNAFYYYLDWEKLPGLPHGAAYFHAMYRQEFPTVMGRNYLIADIAGRGHYVGTVLSVRQHLASWWGEGDDFWFIDGEKEPRLRGTGSEDYFCDAWGLRPMFNPHYGAPVMQGYDELAKTTVYRWHIADPVPFRKSLRLEIEHKGVTFKPDGQVQSGFEERADDFSSVAFWYQTEPHQAYPEMPKGYARLNVDWTKLVEAETLLDAAKATAGPLLVQDGVGGGKGQLFWTPAEENQSLDITIETAQEAEYELILVLTGSWDYGIFQVLIDGHPLGKPIDLYSASINNREHTFAAGTLTPVKHTLSFVNQGKNPASKGVFLGFDSFLLTPLSANKP